jgi:hypothetical protein
MQRNNTRHGEVMLGTLRMALPIKLLPSNLLNHLKYSNSIGCHLKLEQLLAVLTLLIGVPKHILALLLFSRTPPANTSSAGIIESGYREPSTG